MAAPDVTIIKRKPHPCLVLAAIFLILCIGIGIVIFSLYLEHTRVYRSMKEAERALTLAHRAEVANVIRNFESVWKSLDAYKNPEVQYKVATYDFVQEHGLAWEGSHFGREKWYVTREAKIGEIRVLEYSAERFKAIACIKRIIVTMSPDKLVSEAESTLSTRILYVFVREDSEWKIATLYDVYLDEWAYRDWSYATEEQKTYIGELPESLIEPGCHRS